MLPAIALTDEVTALVAAFATMVALHSERGQVVDVSLLESMFQLMGPLISLFRLTGETQPRLGTGLPYTVPRGTYRCSEAVGGPVPVPHGRHASRRARVGEPRFATSRRMQLGRLERHGAWCAARPQAELLRP